MKIKSCGKAKTPNSHGDFQVNEEELKKFVFSETVKIISALSAKTSGYSTAISFFDRVYDDLMHLADEKGLKKE